MHLADIAAEIALEFARIRREALARVAATMAASQAGELFGDIATGEQPSTDEQGDIAG